MSVSCSGGQLKWKENGVDVYFPFDNDYYICIKPVSDQSGRPPGRSQICEAKYSFINVLFYNVRSTLQRTRLASHICAGSDKVCKWQIQN